MNVAFQITVTGTPPLTCQWHFNESTLGGATNRTLLLTNVQLSAAGEYLVAVSNASGSLTSPVAALSIDAAFTKITTGNVASRQLVLTLKGHVGTSFGVVFSHDGTFMATCGSDAKVRLWPSATLDEADALAQASRSPGK